MRASRGRARIGLLVPFTNINLEPDMALMAPAGISFHSARMGGYDAGEIPDEQQMGGLGEADLDGPLQLLAGVRPDLVIYGCTSATLVHGTAFDRALADKITGQSGAKTVTAAGALLHALSYLDLDRIGFASPYTRTVNDRAIAFLQDIGIEVVSRADFGATLDNIGQGALTPEEVLTLGQSADHPEAQAILLSCTEMRSVETLERLEQNLGKPVISSNQALLFQALRLLGIPDPIPGFGRLLREER
ncbi:MAG: Asp/Glu racemase [Pseudomonadota bacterium]